MIGLDELTPAQRTAVLHRDGPLLVLAGPGSGKTRVITRRIARLVETGVDPRDVLAITFTNKAAREMQERVDALLPGTKVWVSTFHRFCARLLRRHATSVGLESNFTIADTADQRQVVRRALDELGIDKATFPAAKIAAAISRAKNDGLRADDYAARFEHRVGTHEQAVVARVFPEYQRGLLASNSVDFDDLLLHVVDLLRENPELRAEYDERYQYVLVDEYQDTNLAQYELVRALSVDHPNLCATGDPDQSIYGWRGARIDNILRFERDYPSATVVRLEANFRSTPEVLRAADALIAHNKKRKAKSLVTANAGGRPVELWLCRDERQEADSIAGEIRRRVDAGERTYADHAICFRVNSLSPALELALSRRRIPFQVAAGVSFFERSEVKDVVAALKLVLNPADRVSFMRVVNTPPRGIGKSSQDRLLAWAADHGLKPLEAAARADAIPGVSKRAAAALRRFAGWYAELDLATAGSVEQLLRTLLERTGYAADWFTSDDEEDAQRLANVNELLSVAHRYDAEHPDDRSLEDFLESISLANEVDNLDDFGEPDDFDPAKLDRVPAGRVTLMTLHAAKGLEFPVVYLVGVEQNLLPHERSLRDPEGNGLEEERRLLFVGMTRAKRELTLTQTVSRAIRGRPLYTIPSDFLREIQSEIEVRDLTRDFDADVSLEIDADQFADDRGHADSDPDRPDPDVEPDAGGAASATSARPRPSRMPQRAAGLPQLTTAAALLEGRIDAAALPLGFAVGQQVRHPHHGRGTIIAIGGYSKHRTVTVAFETEDRTETYVASKSPLQPVGGR